MYIKLIIMFNIKNVSHEKLNHAGIYQVQLTSTVSKHEIRKIGSTCRKKLKRS